MHDPTAISRRALLQQSGLGFGSLALTYLLNTQGALASVAKGPQMGSGLKPTPGDFPARAKCVIQLVQNGGPSQMDLFDPKPDLQRHSGQVYSSKVETFQPGSETNELMGSPFEFRKAGEAGMDFSEALTHTPTIADNICLIRSMYSEHNNHTEALIMLATGKIFAAGRRWALGSPTPSARKTRIFRLTSCSVIRKATTPTLL